MTEDASSIIVKIVEETKKPESEVRGLIQKKIESFGGMLTEQGAAFSVANDLKVTVEASDDVANKELKIKDLVSGMDSVDLVVRVKTIFAPKSFESSKGKGKLVSLVIADDSGECNLTLWHEHVDLVTSGKVKTGTVLKLSNVYVKEFKDKVQVSPGSRGKVIVNPENAPSSLPVFESRVVDLSNIADGDMNINVMGKVLRTGSVRSFSSNGRDGQVSNIEIMDKSGKAKVALWGDNANLVSKLRYGDVVRIDNAYAREGFESVEVNVGWRGVVSINPEDPLTEELKNLKSEDGGTVRKKINELAEGDSCELLGTIANTYEVRSFLACSKCGSKVEQVEDKFLCAKCEDITGSKRLILSFDLDDGSGSIRCTAFGDQAKQLLHLDDVSDDEKINLNLSKLLGKPIGLAGNCREDSYSGGLSFTCRAVLSSVDFAVEAKDIVSQVGG